jgi:hypothetical protein
VIDVEPETTFPFDYFGMMEDLMIIADESSMTCDTARNIAGRSRLLQIL